LWITSSKEGKELSAKGVLQAAQRYIDITKRDDPRYDMSLPSLRKTQEILSEARTKYKDLPPHEAQYQKPWSLATLDNYPLPPESLNAVVHVWRYALMNGETLTIRQAKWISRVYKFQKDVTKLWIMSYEYAKREEVFKISNQPFFSTLNDDLRIAFSTIEVLTIWKTTYGEKPFPDPFSISIPKANDGGVMNEVLHPVDYYLALYNGTVVNQRDKELHALLSKQPSLEHLGLFSNELRVIYLIWVSHIKKLPDWQKVNAKQALNVIKKLRQWALKTQEYKYSKETHEELKDIARITENKIVISSKLPIPEEALKALTDYALKEDKS
jgi:hypothetical protein